MTILFVVILASYAAGILLPPFLRQRPKLQALIAHSAAMVAGGTGVFLGVLTMLSEQPWAASFPSTLPFLSFAVRMDPLSAFFVLIISLIGMIVSVYSFGYLTEYFGRASIGALGSLYNGFLACMTLVVMADNAFFFLLAWEGMSLLSYFLVMTEHEKPDVRYAGLFYLIMTHVGTAFVVLTFLVFFNETHSFSFDAFRSAGAGLTDIAKTVAFFTALIGFGAKAGIVPLHVWLPYAHPAAPSHISAVMSGVMIKTAIYGLIRVYFDFFGGQFPWWWGVAVLVVGGVSALLGVLYALMEHDIKRLLAFHSVENIGIILLGLGAGMIFQSYGLHALAALGLLAASYHTLNHAVFKALLFLGAGAVVYATHTRNIEEHGGLLRRMPWTGVFFLIGAVSISALPPTNGFVSEWLVFQTLFLSFHLPVVLFKLLLPIAAAVLALTGMLALVCFAKAFGLSFLALPRSSSARDAKEVPVSMRWAMGALACCCVILGVAPMLVVPLGQFFVPVVQGTLLVPEVTS